jgi:putative tricarboxylic transport membrane protein
MFKADKSRAWTRRSSMLALGAMIGFSVVLSQPSQAQDMRAPSGPVEITVGSSAGGTPDVMMRRMVQVMTSTGIIKDPMVVVNRTGGSWMVASNWVLQRAGDENTYLAIAQPMLTTPITQGLPNTYEKLTPLSMFIQADLVIVAQPDSPAKSLKDLVAIAKERPRSVRQAGAQVGSTDYLVTGLLQKAGEIEINYVPFDGGGAAQTAFLGGNVDMLVLTVDEALPLVESGKAKILAILNETRRTEAALADIPTAKEQGLDVVWGQAWGIAGAENLDPTVVAWWDDKLSKLVQTDEWKKMLADNYLRGEYTSSKEAKPQLEKIYQDHLQLMRDLKLSKQ